MDVPNSPVVPAKDPVPTEPVSSDGEIDMTLEASIRAGDLAAAIDLLRSGADAIRRGPEGLTPLTIASGLGHSQMVDLLLTAGAEVLAVEPRMGATVAQGGGAGAGE